MKEYIAKKYIFAAVFMVVLYALSISNLIFSFDNLKEDMYEANKNIKTGNIEEVLDSVNSVIDTLDTSINNNVENKYKYIELFGLYNKVLGKYEYNGFSVIKDKNDNLFNGNPWSFNLVNEVPTDVLAKRVYNMQKKLDGTDTQLYVLSMPLRTASEYINVEPGAYVQDYSSVADTYLYYCDVFNINTIDFRIVMKKSGLEYDDLFFKTDHHWTPQAAFISFQYLVNELKKDGYDLDITGEYTDINNYNIENYEECWLGTHGIKTGASYIEKLESIKIISPKFKTDFEYSYRYSGDKYTIKEEGSFDETLLNREHIYEQQRNDFYEGSAYSAYLNGVCEYDRIINKKNPDGPKVLFIRDSYTSPLASFFANLCSEVEMIWAKEYSGSIEELVENGDYDFVFISTWPENLAEDSFNFYIGE